MAIMINDNLWFCEDCMIASVNADYTGMEDDRTEEVKQAINKLPGYPVSNFDENSGIEDFSHKICDCCNSRLAGKRYRFLLLD